MVLLCSRSCWHPCPASFPPPPRLGRCHCTGRGQRWGTVSRRYHGNPSSCGYRHESGTHFGLFLSREEERTCKSPANAANSCTAPGLFGNHNWCRSTHHSLRYGHLRRTSTSHLGQNLSKNWSGRMLLSCHCRWLFASTPTRRHWCHTSRLSRSYGCSERFGNYTQIHELHVYCRKFSRSHNFHS